MAPVTTRYTPKPFAWSWSRMKNFELCPKRHYEIDLTKNVKEEQGEALLWGGEVHKAMADRCSKGTPLPITMDKFEKWAAMAVTGGGNILVEQKMSITKEFKTCGFFADDVWFRGIADFIKFQGPVALIIDWKTGKITEDSQQLALSAACVFAAYPDIQAVRSEFIWLKEDANTTDTFRRNDMPAMWKNLWPRIESLEQAHKTTSYPATPGHLCRNWCPVESCPHHGKS